MKEKCIRLEGICQHHCPTDTGCPDRTHMTDGSEQHSLVTPLAIPEASAVLGAVFVNPTSALLFLLSLETRTRSWGTLSLYH